MAAINEDAINMIIEAVKKFFNELIKPDMTIEKIAEVASPHLDKIIEQNEAKGLKYAKGKFKIEYVDDKHFTLEFEMYFKDDAGKWYKAANKSELRDAELIEPGSWKTLKALKVVEFPIGEPNSESKRTETPAADTSTAQSAPTTADNSDSTSNKSEEITLDKLMGAKK